MRRFTSLLFLFLLLGSLAVVTAPVRAQTSYYGVQFDGATSYVSLSSGLGLSNATQFSIIVIARPEPVGTGHNPLVNIYSNATSGIWFVLANGNVMHLGLGNGTNWFLGVDGPTVQYGVSALLAVTWNSTTAVFYYNKERVARSFTINQVGKVSLGRIGWAYYYWANHPLNGTIYEVLIYNRALSDSEIQQIYSDPLNPPTTGLVLFYAPDSVDTVNNVWTDKSGNGNDGTIVNATYVPLRPVSEALQTSPVAILFNGSGYLQTPTLYLGQYPEFTLVAVVNRLNESLQDNFFSNNLLGDNLILWRLGSTAIAWQGGHSMLYFGDSGAAAVSTSVIHDHRWYLLAVAGWHSNNTIATYINGKLDGVVSYSAMNYTVPSTFTIGKWGGSYAHIYLSAFYIYARALNSTEIREIYEHPLDPPKDGLVLFYSPYSYDPSTGKWLNVAPIFPTIPLAEELDATNYGAEPVRVSIPNLTAINVENNSIIPTPSLSVNITYNGTTTALIPTLLTLPYNTTVQMNVSTDGYFPISFTAYSGTDEIMAYLRPIPPQEPPLGNATVPAIVVPANLSTIKNQLQLKFSQNLKDFFASRLGIAVALMIVVGIAIMSLLYHRNPIVTLSAVGVAIIYLSYYANAPWGVMWTPMVMWVGFGLWKMVGKGEEV